MTARSFAAALSAGLRLRAPSFARPATILSRTSTSIVPPPTTPILLLLTPTTTTAAAVLLLTTTTAAATTTSCSGTASPSASTSLALSPTDILEISAIVAERVDLPFVPRSWLELMVAEVVTVTLQTLETRLPPDLRRRLFLALHNSSTQGGSLGAITPEMLDETVDVICASDIADKLPLLSDTQRHELVKTVLEVLIGDVNASSLAQEALGSTIAAATETVALGGLGPAQREALVAKLNEKIDLPMLSDEDEAALIRPCVDIFSDALEAAIPPRYAKALADQVRGGMFAWMQWVLA